MDRFALAVLHRPGASNVGSLGGAQSERYSFDFVVSGQSLYAHLAGKSYDMVGALGWLPDEFNQRIIEQLLLQSEPPVVGNRQMIFVCAECGDLGCGALTAEVVREGETVVWQGFGYENDYDPAMSDFGRFASVGPFRFDWTEYRAVIQGAHNARPAV